MYLLSDSPWGDFPTWVQAIIAIPMLIIACITLLQEKKIKQLTDIVVELQNQTKELKTQSEILAKRYDLERELSLKKRIPYFEKGDFHKTGARVYAFILINSGIQALNVRVFDLKYSNPIRSFQLDTLKDIKPGWQFKSNIDTAIDWAQPEALNFGFRLQFSDGAGNTYSQTVSCVQGIITIAPPEDVK
jgi:hypothetical protein